MRTFVDADGVLADYTQHVIDLFGVHPHEVPDPDLWKLVEAVPDFWLTIPLKYGADELWTMVKPYSPVILTGCPRTHYDIAASQKVTWAKRHFGDDVQVITCLSREKMLYIESPGDILIDDRSSNIKRWRKAGGQVVHYRTVDQAIAELKVLLDATSSTN